MRSANIGTTDKHSTTVVDLAGVLRRSHQRLEVDLNNVQNRWDDRRVLEVSRRDHSQPALARKPREKMSLLTQQLEVIKSRVGEHSTATGKALKLLYTLRRHHKSRYLNMAFTHLDSKPTLDTPFGHYLDLFSIVSYLRDIYIVICLSQNTKKGCPLLLHSSCDAQVYELLCVVPSS